MNKNTTLKQGSRLCRCLALLLLLGSVVPARAQNADVRPVENRVAETLCDKKIVVLGELPSHGEGRAFLAKARIVDYLVDACGFGAVFFEAPVYDFLGFQEAAGKNRAEPAQLDNAIGGFWLTTGLRSWREGLFNRASKGRLILAGLDDQVSATSVFARSVLPELIGASVPTERQLECRQAVTRNLNWMYDAEHAFDEAEQVRLQECARFAADALNAQNTSDIQQRLMVTNLANLYERQVGNPGAKDRDEMMYRNVAAQHERLPDSSRIVIWTATVHAARQQGGRDYKPLGTWLNEQWGEDLAVLGLTAFAGQSSMAGMPVKPIAEAPPGSLEARVTDEHDDLVYLGRSDLAEMGQVSSRLFGRFITADWSTLFDGVFVVRLETAPEFEPR